MIDAAKPQPDKFRDMAKKLAPSGSMSCCGVE